MDTFNCFLVHKNQSHYFVNKMSPPLLESMLVLQPSSKIINRSGKQQQKQHWDEFLPFIDLTNSQLRSIENRDVEDPRNNRVGCFSDVLRVKGIPSLHVKYIHSESDDGRPEEDDPVDRHELWYSNSDFQSFRRLYRKEQAVYLRRKKSPYVNIHNKRFLDDDECDDENFCVEGLDVKGGKRAVKEVLKEQALQQQESLISVGGENPVINPETLSLISKYGSNRSVEEASLRGLKLHSELYGRLNI